LGGAFGWARGEWLEIDLRAGESGVAATALPRSPGCGRVCRAVDGSHAALESLAYLAAQCSALRRDGVAFAHGSDSGQAISGGCRLKLELQRGGISAKKIQREILVAPPKISSILEV